MKPAAICAAIFSLAAAAIAKPPPPKAHPIANGTFIQDYLCRNWTDATWLAEFRYMKALGMRYMVFGAVADGKTHTCVYPTSLPGYHLVEPNTDPLGACLRNAEKAGIRVFVGLNFHGDWWARGSYDSAWLNSQMEEGNRIADELYNRYHARYPRAFYGWYWVWEVDNISAQSPSKAATLSGALDVSVRHLKSLNPGMPVMLCPFMNYRLGTPALYRGFWERVFASCALGRGDIFAPQDCVGAGGLTLDNFAQWFAALRKAVDTKPGLVFWSDTETFYQDDWTSATLNRFVRQLKGVQPYVEGSITFAWSHYYSPNNVDAGWQKTYAGYVRTGKLESVPPSTPRHLRAARQANGTVRVTWEASTDNVGICGYYVFRNGVRVSRQQGSKGLTNRKGPQTTYIDRPTAQPPRASYEVQAYDFAGNVSRRVGPVSPVVVPATVKSN
ncbi:MAG TPA: DUF4434 domain-containing protein [Armatimonadota bacterium]|jgi:hypothetical protein